MTTDLKSFLRNANGAASIEFAMVAVPLFFLIIGTVEVGRYYGIRNNLEYAADTAQRMYALEGMHPKVSDSSVLDRIKPIIENRFFVGLNEKLTIEIKTKKQGGTGHRTLELVYADPISLPGIRQLIPEVRVIRPLAAQF